LLLKEFPISIKMAAKESFFNSPPVKIKRELKGSCVFQLDLIFSIKSKREGKRKIKLERICGPPELKKVDAT